MPNQGDLVLAKHYKDLLDIVKNQLDLRLLTTSEPNYGFNYQNQIVKADELNFLIDKLDLLKKYDDTAGLNYENQEIFLDNLNSGKLNSITYNIDKVTNKNLIIANTLNLIESKIPNHTNVCICNCNYCSCNCNYCSCNANTAYANYCACNCNYCACNCNYCACNCNYYGSNKHPSYAVVNVNNGVGMVTIPGEGNYYATSSIDYVGSAKTETKVYFLEKTIQNTLEDKIFQLKFKEGQKLGTPTKAEKITFYPGKWYKLQLTNGEMVYNSKGQNLFRATWGKLRMRIELYNVTDFHLYWDSKITLN